MNGWRDDAGVNAGAEAPAYRAAALTDEQARDLITSAIDRTLIVEAAAGTGKTTALVERIVRVIESGRAEVRQIVAVTFTEKAAGELKLRLRERLEVGRRKTKDAVAAGRLDAAVQNLEEAHVSTIHGFCADLLRERPVEARVDPLFRVLTEGQSERLFHEAFDRWFQAQLESPSEGVRRSLRRSSRGLRPGENDEDGPMVRLRRAGFELVQWRDYDGGWTRDAFDRRAVATAVVDLVHHVATLSRNASYAGDNLFLDTAPVRRLSQSLQAGGHGDDLDGLEGQLADLRRNRDFKKMRKGSGPTYAKGVPRAHVLDARNALVMALDEFVVRADADLAALLRDELQACVDEYERLKVREGALDFLDLLLRARNLVAGDEQVRRHFQQRFTHLFVDEFQDTDPLQAELLMLLAADDPAQARWEEVSPVPGKLFVVGDPKQSIYRFRRADVHVYRTACETLLRAGATFVPLRRSFRSIPNIQAVVNAAFAPVMDGDEETMQARYMPLEPSRPAYDAQPSVVALPVPKPYGARFVSPREIEACLPDAVGAFVHWLVRDSGWTVTERRHPGVRVPLAPRHVCILFRRFVSFGEDITRRYVEALEARGIRHLLVGGKAFHDREEIETLRAALMAIEWPDDQLSVFATLRGALFALGDEELFEYHALHHRFHPFRLPDAETLPAHLAPVRQALATLAELHRQRNRRPVADTIARLLEDTRAHVGFVLRPAGEQALANVLHVAELARQYELDGGMSFRGFVETLQSEAAGPAAEAPILEEGSDGVRLMTVHKAKGLEFPVVILADITARLTPYDANRYIDTTSRLCALRLGGWSPRDLNDHRDLELARERREGERVAYVAATRARDLLVVPAVGDEPYTEGWVSPINAAIYPDPGSCRVQTQAEGCPVFTSRDSVLERPEGDPARSTTVCPGRHDVRTTDAEHSVVWWSPEPAVLSLDAHAPFGLRRDDLIVKDVPPTVLRRRLDTFTAWRQTRTAAIESASVPSVNVMTATEAAFAAAGSRVQQGLLGGPQKGDGKIASQGIEAEVVQLEGARRRPRGRRFGSLVHALLADVPLDDAAVLKRLADAHGRLLGAPSSEVDAAHALVARAMMHPLLQDAARAAREGHCLRETPVTLRVGQADGDATLIEGTVDLAYRHAGGFVVVDFKTDAPEEDVLERYRRQVALYARAIQQATGEPVRAVLMTL